MHVKTSEVHCSCILVIQTDDGCYSLHSSIKPDIKYSNPISVHTEIHLDLCIKRLVFINCDITMNMTLF